MNFDLKEFDYNMPIADNEDLKKLISDYRNLTLRTDKDFGDLCQSILYSLIQYGNAHRSKYYHHAYAKMELAAQLKWLPKRMIEIDLQTLDNIRNQFSGCEA